MTQTRGLAAPHGSLNGKTVVVTGGSDGIGKAIVRALVEAGANVLIISRNEAKTSAAAGMIMTATGRRAITWEIADLSRTDAVRDVAERVLARKPRIDILINNAGAVFLERELTVDGFERTFALNHLGYFTLTLALLERLVNSATSPAPARIINIASRAHMSARFDVNDMQSERNFGGYRAYANSKLCNVMFTRSLARRLDPSRAVVHAVHPGLIASHLAVNNNGWKGRLARRVMDLTSLTAEEGADTAMWLTATPLALANSGSYWVKRQVTTPSIIAQDDVLCEEVWQRSAEYTHIDADAIVAQSMLHTVPR